MLPAGALAGRFGGEEFIVFLPSELVPASLEIAQALRLAVRGINLESGRRKVAVSISIGAATSSSGDQTVQDILNRADAALLQAKTKGRERTVFDAKAKTVTQGTNVLNGSEITSISIIPVRSFQVAAVHNTKGKPMWLASPAKMPRNEQLVAAMQDLAKAMDVPFTDS